MHNFIRELRLSQKASPLPRSGGGRRLSGGRGSFRASQWTCWQTALPSPGPAGPTLYVQFQSYRKSPYHGRLLACGVARNHHPDLWLDHLGEICPSGLRWEELVHHAT